MKKLISVFAALALVGSLAAQRGKKPAKAPAKPAVAAPAVPAMPAVAAPSAASAMASGKAMGLSFGLSVGFVTDMFKQGDKLKNAAGAAGGGGTKQTYANASSANSCASVGGSAGTACSATGDGSSVSLNGIDIGLKVQYDINSWLFVRSGGNYILGLKNTYNISNSIVNTGVTIDTKSTMTNTGSIIEIPALLGINLISNDKGTLYFAGGIAYNIGQYDVTVSATQTRSAGTATTYHDVTNTTKLNQLGVMWLVGGKTKITDSITLFGDVKFMSAAGVGEGKVTGTGENAALTTTAATAASSSGSFSTANGGDRKSVV